MTECDEIVTAMDNLSTKKGKCYSNKRTNTIAINITSTASINYHSKKKILLYFAHSFISDHIIINNYYYLLSLCKTKRYNIKWKIMN